MQLQYHIKYLYGHLYAVSASFEVNGVRKEVLTRVTCNATTLPELVKRTRGALANAFFVARKRDADLPQNNRYEWDCDTSDLQPSLKKDSFCLTKSVPQQNDTGSKRRVLEVKKVNGVWTIVKHDSELLTWSEACELLKQRI